MEKLEPYYFIRKLEDLYGDRGERFEELFNAMMSFIGATNSLDINKYDDEDFKTVFENIADALQNFKQTIAGEHQKKMQFEELIYDNCIETLGRHLDDLEKGGSAAFKYYSENENPLKTLLGSNTPKHSSKLI